MKLRCTENSIRIRLRRSELETLKANAVLSEQIAFPGNKKLVYSIKLGGDNLAASYQSHEIVIVIPIATGSAWIDSEQVGIETHLGLEDGNYLHVLLEKDFPCKDRPEEDKSDLFQDLAQSNSNC